ncbi:hypothetical protein BY996DRAFT_8401795 [Phakopsora pachyrhizi]|nr:hypothetical protein BY996DRAFT_8401795 [Phakopsora pachyrhizi]
MTSKDFLFQLLLTDSSSLCDLYLDSVIFLASDTLSSKPLLIARRVIFIVNNLEEARAAQRCLSKFQIEYFFPVSGWVETIKIIDRLNQSLTPSVKPLREDCTQSLPRHSDWILMALDWIEYNGIVDVDLFAHAETEDCERGESMNNEAKEERLPVIFNDKSFTPIDEASATHFRKEERQHTKGTLP